MTEPVRTILLADMPQAIPVLARWFVAEWGPYYGPAGPGSAEQDLRSCCNRDGIPLALVALDGNGTAIGTVALKPESVASHRHLGPWLAALLVAPEHRGRGIAAALVAAIEQEARRLGFTEIYTGATGLVRGGWHPLEGEAHSLRGPITVYRRDLSEA